VGCWRDRGHWRCAVARVEALEKALAKFGKHGLYCRWKDSRYHSEMVCTCGLDAALAAEKE
jgi:hypothetical protein